MDISLLKRDITYVLLSLKLPEIRMVYLASDMLFAKLIISRAPKSFMDGDYDSYDWIVFSPNTGSL